MSRSVAADAIAIPETSRRYFGWRVALACFFMAFCTWGFAFYGHAAYLAEVQRLNAWPTSLVSGASTLTFLSAGVLSIFANNLIQRFGPKGVVLAGATALSVSLILIAHVTAPWQLYCAFLLMSVAWLAMGLPTITIVISMWFRERRGLALSMALNGASCGGIVVAPLIVALTASYGFTAAMFTGAAIVVLLIVPSALIWVGRPEAIAIDHALGSDTGRRPPLTRAQALRDMRFWSISGAFALVLVAQVGFIVHQIALLDPFVGRATASIAVMVTTAMAVVGRLALGAFVDRGDPRLTSAVSFTAQAWALLIMAMSTDPLVLFACCALFGFSVGNVITLPPLILHREFAPEAFGMLMGLSTSVIALISALGPGLIGLMRDLTGDYSVGLLLSVAIDAVAAVIVMQRPRPAAS